MSLRPVNPIDGRARPVGPPGGGWALRVIAAILVVGALYAARKVAIPLALAILLSLMLAPLAARLERWGRRRLPAVLLTVGLALGVFLGAGYLVTNEVGGLAAELPSYRQNIVNRILRVQASFGTLGHAQETIQEIREQIAATETAPAAAPASAPGPSTRALAATQPARAREGIGGGLLGWPWPDNPFDWRPDPRATQPVPVRIQGDGTNVFRVLVAVLGPLVGPLVNIFIATVLVIYMLLQRDELLARVHRLIGRDHLDETTETISTATSLVSRYLAVTAFINVLHGVVIATGLELIGVPRALLWGLLAAVLRYLPYMGTWVTASIPILLAFALFDDWVRPLLVAGMFLTLDLTSAYFLEPWLLGARIGVTSLAILISAIFWTWLWGGIGLFLATPLTVCLVVIGRHVPQLQFLAVLLSDEPRRGGVPRGGIRPRGGIIAARLSRLVRPR
jgi:predicted PurR-regulated permease PerM